MNSQSDESIVTANWMDVFKVYFYRIAASGALPGNWFEKRLSEVDSRAARTGKLTVELVSHCWGYSHMMVYQLSSLVLHPPENCSVTMTVFYSLEDAETTRLLKFIEQHNVPGVTWNWQPLHRYLLFRRSIGRNEAALNTTANWIWFTDCDLVFHHGCLDELSAQLQGRQEALFFPLEERTTALLTEDDPLLKNKGGEFRLKEIRTDQFETHQRTRATGPLQITHGDVARACGYCDAIPVYQKPAAHWCKAHEDRAFRWLLDTQGTGINFPGTYRIRHITKGRYRQDKATSKLRTKVRQVQSTLRGE